MAIIHTATVKYGDYTIKVFDLNLSISKRLRYSGGLKKGCLRKGIGSSRVVYNERFPYTGERLTQYGQHLARAYANGSIPEGESLSGIDKEMLMMATAGMPWS